MQNETKQPVAGKIPATGCLKRGFLVCLKNDSQCTVSPRCFQSIYTISPMLHAYLDGYSQKDGLL